MNTAHLKMGVIVSRPHGWVTCAALALLWAAAPGLAASAPDAAPAEIGPGLFLSPANEPAADPVFWGAPEAAPAPDTGLPSLKDWEQLLGGERSMKFDPALLAAAAEGAAAAEAAMPAEPVPEAKPEPKQGPQKGPPLPLYTIEGVGGGLICPMAYLVNANDGAGPTAGYTFVKIGHKTAQSANVTQTFFKRIELGYNLTTLDLGDFPKDVQSHTGIDIDIDHIVMHNFNLRGLLIPEKDWWPTLTAGATFKYTPVVQTIDKRLFGGVRALGMARSNGTDFTLTASKTFPKACFGRPIMTTAGLRFSQGAELGLLGFGDAYRLTAEGSVCVPITDWLAMAYEFRQKKNPYRELPKLVGSEDNWHTICLAFILGPRCALACGWGHFGNVVNNVENGVWGFEFKYEF